MCDQQLALRLNTPQTFPKFPYDVPYDIQVSLMKYLYTSIEEKKVAIAESPTGTGKTSSLLCAAFTWLDDHRDRAQRGQLEALSTGTSRDNEPDWVLAQTRARLQRQIEADDEEYKERLAQARHREEIQRRMSSARVRKRRKPEPKSAEEDEDAYLPEDDSTSSVLSDLIAAKKNPSSANPDGDKPACTKVFYASRTHSQLSQVIPELQKLRRLNRAHEDHVASSSSNKRNFDAAFSLGQNAQEIQSRVVALGSRKQLCINEELKAKSSDIDESCRELLQAGSEKRCSYLPKSEEEGRLYDFRDQILASPKDIEDLVTAGENAHICPYFASRSAIPQAELVTLPYNLLLQPSAREALNIELDGHIVIVDEAHNLTSSLLDLSTVTVPLRTLDLSILQLANYIHKFKNRLASRHRLHLQRLHLLLQQLKILILDWHKQGLPSITMVRDVLSKLGRNLDGINVLEIRAYLKSSRIARKIASYSHTEENQKNLGDKHRRSKRQDSSQPPLYAVQDFIVALAEANDDGRIVITGSAENPGGMAIKYQSLNAAPHFHHIVETARSVILAGGTMAPMSDVINNLFPYLSSDRIGTFSCGHIIPTANLQTIMLPRGPKSRTLKLNAANLNDRTILAEIGQILLNFARIAPGGIVVFLPSYKVLESAMKSWKEARILDSIYAKKKIFIEPNSSSEVPSVLQAYATEIHSSGGAILFAVVGAKLSEGLNFSDDLARMIVVVGLPFPNLGSPELIERLRYADRIAGYTNSDKSQYGPAGRELYENMCMNSVNQSIGRAIRHKNDWAALVLIDERYLQDRVSKKLPGWIGRSIARPESFGQAIKCLGQFFSSKKFL